MATEYYNIYLVLPRVVRGLEQVVNVNLVLESVFLGSLARVLHVATRVMSGLSF